MAFFSKALCSAPWGTAREHGGARCKLGNPSGWAALLFLKLTWGQISVPLAQCFPDTDVTSGGLA